MEVGFSVLGFSCDSFWSITFPEFRAAYDGYKKANRIDEQDEQVSSMSRDEFEQMKQKFPDNKEG